MKPAKKPAKKPVKKVAKRPRGAPTLYREEYCQGIQDFMATGASLTEFAVSIGVVRDTIYEWAKVHPSFSDALTRAREKCLAWWEKQGRVGIYDRYIVEEMTDDDGRVIGRKKITLSLNDRLWSRNVASRFPADWSEKKTFEIETDEGTTITIKDTRNDAPKS